MKVLASLALIAAAVFYFWSIYTPREPTTRGDVADRNAALDVIRCAETYSDPSEAWAACLGAVSDRTGRDQNRVAHHVNRQTGRAIFVTRVKARR